MELNVGCNYEQVKQTCGENGMGIVGSFKGQRDKSIVTASLFPCSNLKDLLIY